MPEYITTWCPFPMDSWKLKAAPTAEVKPLSPHSLFRGLSFLAACLWTVHALPPTSGPDAVASEPSPLTVREYNRAKARRRMAEASRKRNRRK